MKDTITDMSNDDEESSKELFSVRLRKATKNIHDVSDALVNAKLGVTISDDSVWAEGLLVFYEVFKFLENALRSHSDSLIGDLLIAGMARTEAIEEDLEHFYGASWKDDYTVRVEVQQYLDHLTQLDNDNPYLLIPYIYHLYMGLFSGGQILQAKVSRDFVKFFTHNILCPEEILVTVRVSRTRGGGPRMRRDHLPGPDHRSTQEATEAGSQ